MKIISSSLIKELDITPSTCLEWVKESFALKVSSQLPAKISLHPQGNDFFNTMPCLLPTTHNYFGVKIVHRIKGAVPALGSDILLYNSQTGELLSMMDADWITTMRTGAVATLAIQTFRKTKTKTYGILGLGNTDVPQYYASLTPNQIQCTTWFYCVTRTKQNHLLLASRIIPT